MPSMIAYGLQSRDLADAKIAGGTWARVGRSHYRRVTGEEVKLNSRRRWDAAGTDHDHFSRYEAMHQVDRKYEGQAK